MPRAIVPYDDLAGPSRSSAPAAPPHKRKRAASRTGADAAASAQPHVRRAPPGVWAPSAGTALPQLRPGLALNDDDDAELPDSLRPLAPPEYAYEAVAPAAAPPRPPQLETQTLAASEAADTEMEPLLDDTADAEGGEWDEEEEWYEEGEEWYGEEEEEEEEEDDGSRPLSHADIWDEDTLVGAWNASVAEYEAFRLRRASAGAATAGASGAPGTALWHDAPAPDSRAARNAHVEGKAYAERRKREGKESDEAKREEKRTQQAQAVDAAEAAEAAEADAPAIDAAIEAAAVPGDSAAEALRLATVAAAEATRLSTAMQARATAPSPADGPAKGAKATKSECSCDEAQPSAGIASRSRSLAALIPFSLHRAAWRRAAVGVALWLCRLACGVCHRLQDAEHHCRRQQRRCVNSGRPVGCSGAAIARAAASAERRPRRGDAAEPRECVVLCRLLPGHGHARLTAMTGLHRAAKYIVRCGACEGGIEKKERYAERR
jgi:hypothetical protein